MIHGRDFTYKKGCRCHACKVAASAAHAEKRMTLAGLPPTPMHGARIIARTCKKCSHLATLTDHPHHCPPRGSQPKATASISSWATGGQRAWRKIRTHVLDRDSNRCRIQLAGCTITATHVHHVLPRETVGDDPRFLVAACAPCNIRSGHPGFIVELLHLRTQIETITGKPPTPAPPLGTPEAHDLVHAWITRHADATPKPIATQQVSARAEP